MSLSITNNNPNINPNNTAVRNSKENFINGKSPDLENNSKSHQAGLGLANDFNQFIRLLLEQVKYQDPSEPMKTNEMTQQLVAFTSVEQSVATNSNLEKLIALNQGAQFNHAANLVGKFVTYDAGTVNIDNNNKTGDFIFESLPNENQEIANTNIKIVDNAGNIVRNFDTKSQAGRNKLYWDGLDNNNKQVANGNYKILVNIYDQQGAAVKVGSSHIKDEVKATEVLHNKVQLVTANTEAKVDIKQIIKIENNQIHQEEKKL